MSTVWYVEAAPGITSETFGREVDLEDVCHDVFCGDGRSRDLYRVSWKLLRRAVLMGAPLKFVVWRQQGTTLPRRYDPTYLIRGQDTKVQEMAAQLDQQLQKKGKAARS